MASLVEKVYCAFCRLERRVYVKRRIGWTNVLLSLGAAALISIIAWGGLDPRVAILFCVFLVIAEIFVQLRWRLTIPCPHCGFDPVLYKINREETVRRVQAKLAEVRARGDYLLKKNNPLKNLPVRVLDDDSKDKTGRIVSREI